MKIKWLGWGTLTAGLAALAIAVLAGTSPSMGQMPAQSATSPSQTPTLGTHAPQAEGQPSWMEGMTAAQKESPLHPDVPNMLGHPAKDISIQNFKRPAGFKIELFAGDLQEARSMAT